MQALESLRREIHDWREADSKRYDAEAREQDRRLDGFDARFVANDARIDKLAAKVWWVAGVASAASWVLNMLLSGKVHLQP